MSTKGTVKTAELMMWAQERNCSVKDILLDALYDFYESAGFERERLDAEFGVMSEDELMEVFLSL